MIEKQHFYLIVFCLTHTEKHKQLINPSAGFFVKLKRQYYTKDEAISNEQDAMNKYVLPCALQFNRRIFPSLEILNEKEYELERKKSLFKFWKTHVLE